MGVISLPKNLHPGFSIPNRVPVGAVEIDWENPLTGKLGFCLVANSPNPVDLVTGSVLIKGSGVLFSGGSYVFDRTANGIITIPDSNSNFDKRGDPAEFSAFVIANFDSSNSNYPSLIARGDTSANEWMFREPILGSSVGRLGFYGNTGDLNAEGTSNSVVGDTYLNYGFSVGSFGVNLYTGGANVGNDATGNLNVGSITKPITIGGADGNSGRYFGGKIKLVLGFQKPLSDAEHRALSANPYQILKPAVPMFYMPAAAGGGPSVNINGSTVSWNGLTSYNWNGIA